jgi:hypothetical protein
MHTREGAILITAWILLSALAVADDRAGTPSDSQDVAAVRLAWKTRVADLRRLSVEFRYALQRFTRKEDLALTGREIGKGVRIRIHSESPFGRGGFWRDGLQWRYYWRLDDSLRNTAKEGFLEYVASKSTDRFEKLEVQRNSEILGLISTKSTIPGDQYFDVALGLRLARDDTPLAPETIDTVRAASDAEGRVTFIVERKNDNDVHLTFDIRSLSLVSYEERVGDKVYFRGDMTDFVQVGEFALPQEAVFRRYRRDGTVSLNVSYAVERYDTLQAHDFRIQWPLRAVILDSRTGANIKIASAPQSLSDATLKIAAQETGARVAPPQQRRRIEEDAPNDRRGLLIAVNCVVGCLIIAILVIRRYARARRR